MKKNMLNNYHTMYDTYHIKYEIMKEYENIKKKTKYINDMLYTFQQIKLKLNFLKKKNWCFIKLCYEYCVIMI